MLLPATREKGCQEQDYYSKILRHVGEMQFKLVVHGILFIVIKSRNYFSGRANNENG